MELLSNGTAPTINLTTTQNDTLSSHSGKPTSHNWEFLVAVLATAISISILIALLAKCQVVRRYLASYRHTRLREGDSISQCDPSEVEDDDDGFIEDNYIQASERERAERAVENTAETDEEEDMDDMEFTIA
ncbi:type III endosome membrane protein TEMP isoform 2-T2 [Polymixia lowei]